jgi:hypothetical protein
MSSILIKGQPSTFLTSNIYGFTIEKKEKLKAMMLSIHEDDLAIDFNVDLIVSFAST